MKDFGTIARARQAAFRDTLPPPACVPDDGKSRRNGHVLPLGQEAHTLMPELRGPEGVARELALRKIKWWRSERSGDDPELDGPSRNLASSQVACINWLMPLVARPEALLAFARLLDPELVELLPIPDPEGVAPALVQLEWAGWDRSLEGTAPTRGAWTTSVDALLVGRRASGRLHALVCEWKYCEEYPNPSFLGEGRSGATRRRRYEAPYRAQASSFTGEVALEDFFYEPLYQLMRQRLLADRMQEEGVAPGLQGVEATVFVVVPAANEAYRTPVPTLPLSQRFPEARTVEELMGATMKEPRGLRLVASEDLLAGLAASPVAGQLGDWLAYHRARYFTDPLDPSATSGAVQAQ